MSLSQETRHVPVLRDEVLEALACTAGKRYVDGTIGGGGYAEAILEASGPDGLLLGLDWDEDALKRAARRLSRFSGRFFLERGSYDNLSAFLKSRGWERVDGIVLDLGVSSDQVEDADRGFSFAWDGPLDMRMDRGNPVTAADLVNRLPEHELADVIRTLGEERWARRIARAIAARRADRPFSRTLELAALVAAVVPKTADSRRIHPATRTFLALRLAVNRELQVLERFLQSALDLLNPGGRLAVVTFHSLEDRLVKRAFQEWAKPCRCPPEAPKCTCGGQAWVRLLPRKGVRPSEQEVAANPRARSARLRALERRL